MPSETHEARAMIESEETRPVRAGEELDAACLNAYLKAHIPGWHGPLVVEQFPHGHSNLTYLIRAGDRELVLRRPPFGNPVKTAHDMAREYRVLARLSKVYNPAPEPYAYCDDESVIGVPFYVMERRRGIILRGTAQGVALDPATLRRACEALIDNLAVLHMLDSQAAGLADLGKPSGYVERQVKGWSERYRNAQTDLVPALDEVASWLAQSRPADAGAALIHNDYKFDNIVLDPGDLTRIVAVLDWEMARIGDPLMDLGTTLGYWVEAGDPPTLKHLVVGPTMQPGSLSRRALAERYLSATGRGAVD